jgi:N-dimethylarginine dimethylaminohydrolase
MYLSNAYVMCAPDYYDVSYVINPWMDGNINRVEISRSRRQWQRLYELIAERAEVELVAPQTGLPDMPFIANAGLVFEDKIILSRFLHPERQGEEKYFEDWFAAHDYKICKLPPDIAFEGAGDCLLDRSEPLLWAGYGFRSDFASHAYLAGYLELDVLSLRLVDERFYHLDTCFCPLEGGHLLYFPQAFDADSQRLIADMIPSERRIVVAEPDAITFACNAINIGDDVILNQVSASLCGQLADAGFNAVQTDLSEFIKGGGAAKCLTLRLNEPLLQTVLMA